MYSPIDAVMTDENGAYSFSGLEPGIYSILQSHPLGYVSIGSMGGYVGVVETSVGSGTFIPATDNNRDGDGTHPRVSGFDIQSDAESIQMIHIGVGQYSQENNFGEGL